MTISKSITINGDGTLAGIITIGTDGIVINAGASDVVTIRNLSIKGSGANGVYFIAGKRVVIENVNIEKFSTSGILVGLTGTEGGELILRNVHIKNIISSVGIYLTSESSRLGVSVIDSSVIGCFTGISLESAHVRLMLTDSVISGNTDTGVYVYRGAASLINNKFTANGTAILSATNGNVRLSRNSIFDNRTGIGCGGGKVMTDATNAMAGNVGGAPNCGPNAALTIQ